jgi:hypothetical protein
MPSTERERQLAEALRETSPEPAADEDMRLRDGLGAAYTQLTSGDVAGAQRILEAVLAGGDVPDLPERVAARLSSTTNGDDRVGG